MAKAKDTKDLFIKCNNTRGKNKGTMLINTKSLLDDVEPDFLPIDKYMEPEYFNLHVRDRKLIDDIALAVPYVQIYDEYVSPYEHACCMKDQYLVDEGKEDLTNTAKRKFIFTIVKNKGLGKFITSRRNQINDIQIETYRLRAVQHCVSVDFIKNELVNLREKTSLLDTEKQVKYELKILETLDKVIKGIDTKESITNIQINNSIPDIDK